MQNFKKRSKTFNIKIFLNYETQILRLNFKYQIFNPPAISPTHPKPLQPKKYYPKSAMHQPNPPITNQKIAWKKTGGLEMLSEGN